MMGIVLCHDRRCMLPLSLHLIETHSAGDHSRGLDMRKIMKMEIRDPVGVPGGWTDSLQRMVYERAGDELRAPDLYMDTWSSLAIPSSR